MDVTSGIYGITVNTTLLRSLPGRFLLTVLEVRGEAAVVMANGRALEVQSEIPLQPGQTLFVRQEQGADGQIRLRVLRDGTTPGASVQQATPGMAGPVDLQAALRLADLPVAAETANKLSALLKTLGGLSLPNLLAAASFLKTGLASNQVLQALASFVNSLLAQQQEGPSGAAVAGSSAAYSPAADAHAAGALPGGVSAGSAPADGLPADSASIGGTHPSGTPAAGTPTTGVPVTGTLDAGATPGGNPPPSSVSAGSSFAGGAPAAGTSAVSTPPANATVAETPVAGAPAGSIPPAGAPLANAPPDIVSIGEAPVSNASAGTPAANSHPGGALAAGTPVGRVFKQAVLARARQLAESLQGLTERDSGQSLETALKAQVMKSGEPAKQALGGQVYTWTQADNRTGSFTYLPLHTILGSYGLRNCELYIYPPEGEHRDEEEQGPWLFTLTLETGTLGWMQFKLAFQNRQVAVQALVEQPGTKLALDANWPLLAAGLDSLNLKLASQRCELGRVDSQARTVQGLEARFQQYNPFDISI